SSPDSSAGNWRLRRRTPFNDRHSARRQCDMVWCMRSQSTMSRRGFLAATAAAPLALASPAGKHVPIGLELYSVPREMGQDMMATIRAVAKMGYEVVEFFSAYYNWTPEQAKDVRKLLDDLGIKCNSTHNGLNALKPEGISKAIDINHTIGAKYIVLASAGRV